MERSVIGPKSYCHIIFEVNIESCQKVAMFISNNWGGTSSMFLCKNNKSMLRIQRCSVARFCLMNEDHFGLNHMHVSRLSTQLLVKQQQRRREHQIGHGTRCLWAIINQALNMIVRTPWNNSNSFIWTMTTNTWTLPLCYEKQQKLRRQGKGDYPTAENVTQCHPWNIHEEELLAPCSDQ